MKRRLLTIVSAYLFSSPAWTQTPSKGPVVIDAFTSARQSDMVAPDDLRLWREGQVGQCVTVTSVSGGSLVYAAPNSGPTCNGQWVDGVTGYGMANLLFFPRGDSGGGTGGTAPNGWQFTTPCDRAHNCEYAQGYASTIPGATNWTTLNRLYFTITSDTTYAMGTFISPNADGHTVDGIGTVELGWYIRSHDNSSQANQGSHYYTYISTGIYAGHPLYFVVNRKFQHNNCCNGADQYPEDAEFTACCQGLGNSTPIHVWDGETSMYVTAGPNLGRNPGWTGNFTFSPWTVGASPYSEPDDWVSALTGTYNGTAYEVSLEQPKLIPGGVNYHIYYSSANSMHVTGISSGTSAGAFRGQDASNYTGFWWKSPNIAEATNMWVAIRPDIPIWAVTGTSPITVQTRTPMDRHWLQTGNQVAIANLCAAANGTRTVTVIDNFTVSLGVSGACSYGGYVGTGSGTLTATSDTQNFTEILIGPGAAPATGATNVQTLDSTAQQVRLHYFAAAAGDSCTVKISRSASLTPLEHDVDPAFFPGQDQDLNRTLTLTRSLLNDNEIWDGALVNGRERTVILGRPFAVISPVDGYTYSMSLPEASHLYYSVQCPSGSAVTGEVDTQPIAVGAGYGRKNRVDPRNGWYLWPSNSPAVQEEVIDPLTGAIMYQPSMMWMLASGNSTGAAGMAFPHVDGTQTGWACSDATQSIATCTSDLATADSSYMTSNGTNWAFLGIASAPGTGFAPSNSTTIVELAFQNLKMSMKCVGLGCSTAAQVEVGVTKLGPAIGTEPFHLEPPSRTYSLAAGGSDTTVIFCKDVPCSSQNKPGDHMTNLMLGLFSNPTPSAGHFSQSTPGSAIWQLSDNNDCLRMTPGELVQTFDGGPDNSATIWTAIINSKSCGGSPSTFNLTWATPASSKPANSVGGLLLVPLITGPTAFYYESGLFSPTSGHTPYAYNMRYGFGVRCKNCDGTRQLAINQALWIASSSTTVALNFGSGGMGDRYTKSPSANGYYYGDVNGYTAVGVKVKADGSPDIMHMGFGLTFPQQSDNIMAIASLTNVSGQPVRLTTTLPHGFHSGMQVIVAGLTGPGGSQYVDINGGYSDGITVIDATHLDLATSKVTGNGTTVVTTGATVTYRGQPTYYLTNGAANSTPWSNTDPRDLYFLVASSYPAGTLLGKPLAAGRPVLFKFHYTGNDVSCGASGPCPAVNPFQDSSWPAIPITVSQVGTCPNNCVDPTNDNSLTALVLRNDPNFDQSFYGGFTMVDIAGTTAVFEAGSGGQDSRKYYAFLDLTSSPPSWTGKFDMAKHPQTQMCGSHTPQTGQNATFTTIEPDSNKCPLSMTAVGAVPACTKGVDCDTCPSVSWNGFDYTGLKYCSTVKVTSAWNASWGKWVFGPDAESAPIGQPAGFLRGDPVYPLGTSATCTTHWVTNLAVGGSLFYNYNQGELMKIIASAGSDSTSQSWIVERGAAEIENAPSSFPDGQLVTAVCSILPRDAHKKDNEFAARVLIPSMVVQPTQIMNHAFQAAMGMWDPVTHTYDSTIIAGVQPKYNVQIRDTSSPSSMADYKTNSGLGMVTTFGGVLVGTSNGNAIENHGAPPGVMALPPLKQWFIDVHPLLASGSTASYITAVGGSLYDYFVATSNPDEQNQKQAPKHGDLNVYLGQIPGKRVDVIGQTAADDRKFCYAYIANDCFSGSVTGHLYFNSVNIDIPHLRCFGGEFFATQMQPCVITENSQALSTSTWLIPSTNGTGSGNGVAARVIAKGTSFLAFGDDVTGNAKAHPSSKLLFPHSGPRAWRHSVPTFDNIRRDTFVPVTVSVKAAELPAGTTGVFIQFGYDSNFYCSANRNEACVAASVALNPASPYFYPTVDGAQSVSCGSGCSIPIPGISGRFLFWRLNFAGSGKAGETHITKVP